MDNVFTIKVFGKAGCQKCKVLNGRIDELLGKPEWQEFAKLYRDIETVDGMVEFCQMECLNPQRIPSFVITRTNALGAEEALANPALGEADEVCGDARLHHILGLQTDYSPKGRGLITPKMIKAVLFAAKELNGQ